MSLLTRLKKGFRLEGARKAPVVAKPRETELAPPPPKSYAAVAIRAHTRACKTARELSGKRFLVADAPKLPLASCNVRCACSYRSYSDRRQIVRRSIDVGISGTFYVGPERRSGRERRVDDGSGLRDYYDFVRATEAKRDGHSDG